MADQGEPDLSFILAEGETFTEAVKAGLKEINLPREAVDVQLVTQPQAAGEKFVVRLMPKAAVKPAESKPVAEELDHKVKPTEPIVVKVSDDGYQAYLSVYPESAKEKLKREELVKALKDSKVVFGLDQKALQSAIERVDKGEGLEGLLIAVGQRAKEPRDAEIEFKIDVGATTAGQVDEKTGRIDFKERDFIKVVRNGDLLAVRRPPVQSVDGHLVTGEVVKMEKAKDRKLLAGKGVVLKSADDGTIQYLAKEDGNPELHGDRIEVSQTAVVEGDVNYNTGNIRTKGSVHIKGKVSSGFEVHAEGDVTVDDVVESGKIFSKGTVVLKSGIKGSDKGEIKADGDVIAMYIERARIEARGNVVVNNVILDSKITCSGWVKAVGGKGEIIGGTIQAAQGVEAKKIGSDFSANTVVEVGRDFFLEREAQEVETKLNNVKTQIQRIEATLPVAMLQSGDLSKVPEAKRAAFQKILDTWRQLKETEKPIEEQMAEIQGKKIDTSKCSILVRETLYTRVTVSIGSAKQIVDREARNVRLMEDRAKKEIRTMNR